MHALDQTRGFGEVMFGHAQLGDQRRVRRLVSVTNQLCKHPGGSLPDKLKSPADLKALYRLCDCEQVTHEAVIDSVNEATLAALADHEGPVVIAHDSTELDYTSHKSLADQLGQIGRGLARGYVCHNSLAIDPDGREVLGLVGQILHHRIKAPKSEPLAKSRARKSRESRLWLRGTERLPADWRLVDVCDQGADTFEFLEHEVHSGRRFVIRSWHDRQIYPGHQATGSTTALRTHARSLHSIGGRTIDVAWQSRHGRRKARPARRAKLLISMCAVLVRPPRTKKGEHGDEPLPMWVVRVWEPHPPRDAERVEWFLLTNEPVESLADAMRVIGWYETRWVVEELHKAMKTGCRIETLQFTKTSRLEPMIGVLSTVAVTLLNLRAASRHPDAKTRRATTLISRDYVEILSIWRYGRVRVLSIHEFFFALARLGGHQNRRGDKRPGWLILWRGWATLQAMLDGAEAIRRKQCG